VPLRPGVQAAHAAVQHAQQALAAAQVHPWIPIP